MQDAARISSDVIVPLTPCSSTWNKAEHVQAPCFGDFFPVLQGQPFLGDRLKGGSVFLFALDTLKLPVVG
jgi:hypothetical protein